MSVITPGRALGQPPAQALLGRAQAMVAPVLRAAIGSLPTPLDRMAGYHFGWCDEQGNPVAATGGKMLRPALVLAAAEACGADPAIAVHAAAAIELLHTFSLIHDDVMDRDELRHGRPTLWRVWGASNAVLVGDTLHTLSLAVAADGVPEPDVEEAVLRLARASISLCAGQYRDCRFETDPPASVAEYLRMTAGKTGALLACSCAVGALCARADHAVIARMDTFGRELGLAFQLIDDRLGIWGDPAVTGKPVGNDLIRRKQTFPVVFACTSGTAPGRELAAIYASTDPVDPAEATDLLERAGADRATGQAADTHLAAAMAALPPQLTSTALESLALLVTQRDR